ncbi:cellulose biosynthesis protein BcsQ [Aeromonas caviae]|uniref:cellulose biosynthesis protein BcsQ n=1 Tax=Aeromonas caviae TaxID=648 RepID=UPI002446AF12|nr:cellulose biosynthesis protein BcsQ [Aeromonas caviae]MDH0027818.1 cellulose biosynthesis protein BcsQ [Aeromonas caviae]MDH1079578.1 cellulose biosynthesis protein BcsQ [Aeromonas caviae]
MNCVALQGIRGGVGTSSLVAGLALAAREQGARVLAVDLCHDNLLGIHLGLPHADARGWSRLADPAREWRSALYHYEEGLDLLSHGGGEGASAEWLAGIDGYDLVLLDLPLGPVPALPCRLLTIVNADANCHVRLHRHPWAAGELLLVTQFSSRRALQQDLLDLWQAAGLPLLGLRLHRDEAMAEAMAAKQPVGRYAPTSLIAHELASLASWCLGAGGDDPC